MENAYLHLKTAKIVQLQLHSDVQIVELVLHQDSSVQNKIKKIMESVHQSNQSDALTVDVSKRTMTVLFK
jgi:hypothetical protein